MATVYNAFAQEFITVGVTVQSLTSGTYAPTGQTAARRATINPQGGDIRYWRSGTTPTSSQGMLLLENSFLTIESTEIANFKTVRDSGSSNTTYIFVEYER